MMASLNQQTSGVELTPKGIGYAEGYGKDARVHVFRSGVDPALDFRHWRASIEAEIERLIGILDEFDGDADLEPTLGSPSSDPGWTNRGGSQTFWAAGSTEDGEAEDVCEDEGAEHDGREPALGWTDMESRYGKYGLGVDGEQEDDDPSGGDVLDEPHDASTSEDCEPDPEPFYPNGSWLPGGSGAA